MLTLTPTEGWRAPAQAGEVEHGWLASFQDPKLMELVNEALKNNPDLVEASATLEGALVNVRKTAAALYPIMAGDYSHEKRTDLYDNRRTLEWNSELKQTGRYGEELGKRGRAAYFANDKYKLKAQLEDEQRELLGGLPLTGKEKYTLGDPKPRKTSEISEATVNVTPLRPVLEQVGKDNTEMSVSVGVSWELDVWRRLANARRGAKFAAEASAADYAAARQSLPAQVANAWFLAGMHKAQLDLAQEVVATYEQTLSVTKELVEAGTVTLQDVATAKADLAKARESVFAAQTNLNKAVRQLEALIGRYPGNSLEVTSVLQTLPPSVPAGLPSQLLERRPDIISAERMVASSFHYSKSASAARLPRISLTNDFGTTAKGSFGHLLDPTGLASTFGANLFVPLFDGGLLQAEFNEARAEQKAAMARYKKAALSAFLEVENLLDNDASLRWRETELQTAAQSAWEASKLSAIRYKGGSVDLSNYLMSKRDDLKIRMDLIVIRSLRLIERVNLHLALGGNFEQGPINTLPLPIPNPPGPIARTIKNLTSKDEARPQDTAPVVPDTQNDPANLKK
jgi:NodT family efflux transporter outer membrane factor (OMF) lipoprotein